MQTYSAENISDLLLQRQGTCDVLHAISELVILIFLSGELGVAEFTSAL